MAELKIELILHSNQPLLKKSVKNMIKNEKKASRVYPTDSVFYQMATTRIKSLKAVKEVVKDPYSIHSVNNSVLNDTVAFLEEVNRSVPLSNMTDKTKAGA